MNNLIKEEIGNILREQAEEMNAFEQNPLEFILNKYPSLNSTMEELMTSSFRDYITGIFVVAPKPTTFKVLLHNGHFFFLIYNPKGYQAKISGKRYNLINLQEEEYAVKAIASLLMLGMPSNSEGPESEETNELEQKDQFIDDLTSEPGVEGDLEGGEEGDTGEAPEGEEDLNEQEEVKPTPPKKFRIIRK